MPNDMKRMTDTQEERAKPEPKIERKGALLLAGMRYEGTNEHGEIPALWDQFMPRVAELISDPARLVAYGVARALPNSVEGGPFEYLACVEVPALENLPTGMVGWKVPAMTYAILPAHGIPGIGPVSDYFYHEWLPQSKEYEMGDGLMIEYYPETFGQDLTIYLHFPVRRT